MSNQAWSALLNTPAPIADGPALVSSVTLTDISPHGQTTNPPYVIPANFLQLGQALRVTAAGRVSTTGTPTLLLGVYYGAIAGVALGTTGAITTTSGVTNVPWRLEATIIIRVVGTSGTALTQGFVHGISGTVGVSVVPIPASAPAAVTIDTTAAKELSIGAQWGTSSASNSITLHQMLVEALN